MQLKRLIKVSVRFLCHNDPDSNNSNPCSDGSNPCLDGSNPCSDGSNPYSKCMNPHLNYPTISFQENVAFAKNR